MIFVRSLKKRMDLVRELKKKKLKRNLEKENTLKGALEVFRNSVS